jgi:hypothetical protein
LTMGERLERFSAPGYVWAMRGIHLGSIVLDGYADMVPRVWSEIIPQSGLMFAARITLPHFSVSSSMNVPNSLGEVANAE